MVPEVLPPVEIPAEKLPPPPPAVMNAGIPMLNPLVLSVATTAVPAVVVDVKPVPANLEDTEVFTKEPDAAEPRKFDELAIGMIDEETDVAMNEPDAAEPRKFDELTIGMIDEELLSAI